MSFSNNHFSVLKDECINSLEIKPNGIYVDVTLGRGGHSLEILKKLSKDGLLISLDQDDDAIEFCKEKFKDYNNIKIIKSNFRNLKQILKDLNIEKIDGILADLGVSSPQLDNSERGFSYKNVGVLDMRMNQEQKLDAKEVLNKYSFEKLCKIFREYGDIKQPKNLVNKIINYRNKKEIETTLEFYDLIKSSLPVKQIYQEKNFANNYFQSIRIEVNDEINALKELLDSLDDIMNIEAVACFISFHSLEDKMINNKFKELSKNTIPKEIPVQINNANFKIIKPKGILPTDIELDLNNRSRSAKLRVLKKIKNL